MENTFRQLLKFDCADKNIFLPRTDEHSLLDKNRKSCCTWNWLVLYGNHVCHSTVRRQCNDKHNYLAFTKYQKFDVEIRGRVNGH